MKKKSGKSISDRRSIMSKNTEALTRGALGVTNSKHLFPLEKKKNYTAERNSRRKLKKQREREREDVRGREMA